MKYLYTVCGIRLLIDIPFKIHIYIESEAFLSLPGEDAQADINMIFRPVDKLPELSNDDQRGHWEIDRLYIDSEGGQQIYHCPSRYKSPYARVTWEKESRDSKRIVSCDYRKGMESYMNYSHNLSTLIGLETLLLKYSGLLLHSSFIRWKGIGILFSAPSGTGKSTQADLWVKYEDAEIINGDRAGLIKQQNQWTAWGLPVAGSSSVYRNESAPVKTIIALRQAPENRIRRLGPAEAFRYLYPEITVHAWDRLDVEQASGLLLKLLGEVPVYLLECRPDAEAVSLVRDALIQCN